MLIAAFVGYADASARLYLHRASEFQIRVALVCEQDAGLLDLVRLRPVRDQRPQADRPRSQRVAAGASAPAAPLRWSR